jgi:ABC-2 type transport system ATP-binding protein
MKILETNDIRKEFGTLVAVNNVNLSLEKGQVLGLIGPNGAGKTTLLRILSTLLKPTSGSARLLGYDILKQYLDIRGQIGFMPDFFNLYNDLTLRECLEFFARAYKIESRLVHKQVDTALEYVELQDKRNDLIRHLSRGMVQRMGVAVLLVRRPEVFLLDEPASGLDPKARIQLREVLKKLSNEGKTIIISSHILTELSGFCTHIAIMNQGSIVLSGSVEDIEQKVIGERNLTISVLDDCEKAASLIRQFPDTRIINTRENTITAQLSAGPDQQAALNALLITNGIKVSSFAEEKTDLEDLFMQISANNADTPLEEKNN